MAPNLVNAGKLLQCNNVDCRVPPTPSQTVIPRRAQSIDYMAKDYDSLLRAMLDLILLPELRARMRRLGSQRATQFSWQKTARETLEVYYDVLDQRQPARSGAVPASLPRQ